MASAGLGWPRLPGPLRRARSWGWICGGCVGAWIAVSSQSRNYRSSIVLHICIQLSSPSNMPGIPTRSNGMPSSASASIFSGCSLASLEAKPGAVYWPLERPVLGISRSFGGLGGGGSALENRILAMKSWWTERCSPLRDEEAIPMMAYG